MKIVDDRKKNYFTMPIDGSGQDDVLVGRDRGTASFQPNVLVAPDDIHGLLSAALPGDRYGLLGAFGHICSFRRYDGWRISVCPIPRNIICVSVMHIARRWLR